MHLPTVKGSLVLFQQRLHGQLQHRVDAFHVFVLAVVPQTGIAQVQGAEGVGEATTQHLLELQAASKNLSSPIFKQNNLRNVTIKSKEK